MTREQFENRYFESPEVWLMKMYREAETAKPSVLTFELLDDLEYIFKESEDYIKCADIVKIRQKIKSRQNVEMD